MIACRPDEPRYIGDQDAFDLQERIIQSIVKEDRTATAKAMIASTPDQVQLGLAEDLKNAMRKGAMDRARARQAIQFLDQPAGKALLGQLKNVRKAFADHKDDERLCDDLLALAAEYRKPADDPSGTAVIRRDDLRLVCFDYLSA